MTDCIGTDGQYLDRQTQKADFFQNILKKYNPVDGRVTVVCYQRGGPGFRRNRLVKNQFWVVLA